MKFTNTIIIKFSGRSIMCRDCEIDFGGFERPSVFADGRRQGYSEKPMAAKITATSVHSSETDIAALQAAVEITVQAQTDTGSTYVFRNATLSTPPVLTGNEGELKLTLEADPGIEQ